MNSSCTTVTEQEQKEWVQRVIPLPKEISLDAKVVLSPDDIALVLRTNAGDIEKNALGEIEQLFRQRSGGAPADGKFTIIVGVMDDRGELCGCKVDQAERLRGVPNRSQAYIIQPSGEDKLLVTAIDEVGVFYGVQTLVQLLSPDLSSSQAVIPLADLFDWPDTEERGVWNHPEEEEWMEWNSEVKLNYSNTPLTVLKRIERDRPNRASFDAEFARKAQLRGYRSVVQLTHLNFLHLDGLFEAYPELAGKGDGALAGHYHAHRRGGHQHRVPFAAHPKLAKILAEWMTDLARQGAREICCWLSERPAEDGRPETADVGQFVLEARACVNAWREACEEYPDLEIRLFLSTTTFERDYRVLAEVPPEIKVIRCCITEEERIQHLPRDLFSNPLFDHYAEQGRWFGTYDVPLNANGRVETPEFKIPMRSAHRIRDFVRQMINRRYSLISGMMAWQTTTRETCEFNVTAMAEWAWNAEGRDEHEFALAYATRKGLNPEKVAEWSDIMGPLSFDVFDSMWPECYAWGLAIDLIKRREHPYLGEGMFRYYGSPEAFTEKLAACDRATNAAQSIENPDFANETRVVRSYVDLARTIWQVALIIASDELELPASQGKLQGHLRELEAAGAENVSAIRHWRTGLGPEPWHKRVHDAITGTSNTVDKIKRHVTTCYLTSVANDKCE